MRRRPGVRMPAALLTVGILAVSCGVGPEDEPEPIPAPSSTALAPVSSPDPTLVGASPTESSHR